MRKFNFILIATLAGCLLMICSCSEDFLIKEPPGAAAGTVMESETGVESIIVGTYSVLQGGNRFAACIATDWMYGSVPSDDSYSGPIGDPSARQPLERYENLPSSYYMRERWEECYDGVARANSGLTFLWAAQEGDNPIPAARATTMEAELKFLRAWYHFKATLIFEKIPYIKTQAELGDVLPVEVPNSSPRWDEIEADLQYAIDNLPPDHIFGEPGRATSYSAMALKVWAHLEQGELADAQPLLDAIIAGPFTLVDNFYDNYNMTTENNSESIFEIQAATSGSNHSSIDIAGGSAPHFGPAGIGWGFFQPSQNLVEAFQVDANGLPILDVASRSAVDSDMGVNSSVDWTPPSTTFDPRMDWTVMRRGVDFLGWGICEGASWFRDRSGGPYLTKKYMQTLEEQNTLIEGRGFDNGKNYRVLTLGHVLLWRAEVAVSEGNLDMALDLVNQIRNRAKSSDVVMGLCLTTVFDGSPIVVDWNQPAANYDVQPYPGGGVYPFDNRQNALKAVQLEERLEFACQGFRFFDLRRWGIDGQVLPAYIAEDIQFRSFLTGASYNPEQDDYWPIPQDQIDLQPGVLTQDPDYK